MSGPRSIPGREWVCPGMGYNRMWMGMYTPWTWAWDTHPPVLTHCGGHHNMYSWQEGGMHPTGRCLVFRHPQQDVFYFFVTLNY